MRATKSTQGLSRARLLRFQWEDRALHGTMGHDPQGSGTKYRWWAAANEVRRHATTKFDGRPRVDRDGQALRWERRKRVRRVGMMHERMVCVVVGLFGRIYDVFVVDCPLYHGERGTTPGQVAEAP